MTGKTKATRRSKGLFTLTRALPASHGLLGKNNWKYTLCPAQLCNNHSDYKWEGAIVSSGPVSEN